MLIMDTHALNRTEEVDLWIDNDILCCKPVQVNYYLTEDKVKVCIAKIEEISEGKFMPFLIDVRKFVGNFSPSAARIFAESSITKENIIVQAFVVDNLNGKLLLGSYKRIYGKEKNIKIFSHIETALAYCIESKNKFYAIGS